MFYTCHMTSFIATTHSSVMIRIRIEGVLTTLSLAGLEPVKIHLTQEH